MTRGTTTLRPRRWLIAGLILPALLFRAAIPAGFMPMLDAQGGISLVVCPGVTGDVAAHGGAPAVFEHHHHHHHDHSGGDYSSGGAPHGGMCPFALSAGPALGCALATAPATVVLAALTSRPVSASLVIATIERAQTARGPPLTHWI